MLTASVCCCGSSGPTSPKISVTKCFWSCLTPNLKQPALTHRVYWFKPPGATSTVLSCHQLLISQHVERRPDNILSISEPRFYLKTGSDISPAPPLILTGGSPKFQLFTFLKRAKYLKSQYLQQTCEAPNIGQRLPRLGTVRGVQRWKLWAHREGGP